MNRELEFKHNFVGDRMYLGLLGQGPKETGREQVRDILNVVQSAFRLGIKVNELIDILSARMLIDHDILRSRKVELNAYLDGNLDNKELIDKLLERNK